ncbi:MAG: Ig-like domain-containing protein, partial [Alistipes sp.]|nr:Ig-like domain-containing protein [Alistipes sp.]
MKNILKYLSLTLLPASLCVSCADDELPVLKDAILMNSITISMPDEVRVKLYVDQTEATCYPMLAGETLQLEYTTDPDPSEVTFPGVEWSSSNPDVVSVAADGVVTAVSAGSAIITVRPDTPNIQAASSMKVTVSETLVAATSIAITDNAVMADDEGVPSCYMGETMQLTAAIEPSETTYRSVKWSSTDESVAAVDMISGLVTGVSRGYVDIVATALDPEHPATASHRIYIDEIVTPRGLKLNNAPAADATFPV